MSFPEHMEIRIYHRWVKTSVRTKEGVTTEMLRQVSVMQQYRKVTGLQNSMGDWHDVANVTEARPA